MSVMQDAFELCRERGRPLDLAHIPKNDEKTFDIMQHADTIGVFQIESRAQMATLPRMKPKCFYDVVIEVAIIRPGPIQGDMVHPYLARRAGKEPVTYFDDRLKPVLERTLGVPLFQEQMLKIAMIMADFSGNEAEELRRALSFHRSEERMRKVSVKLRAAMERKGIAPDKIDKIIQSISSFALYGFPESHAISFAILAYGSAYLKVHRAPEFYASLINNQPMGFYTPATIVKDAQRHGVNIKPVCVLQSDWHCTVVDDNTVRLGFCVVNGLRQEHAEELVRQRQDRPFKSLDDLKRRVPFTKNELRALAELGALNCFAEHRRAAMWSVEETLHDDLLETRPWVVSGVCAKRRKRNSVRRGERLYKNPSIPDDVTRTRESGLRNHESDHWTASYETVAGKLAKHLACDRPCSGAARFDDSDRRQRHLPSASGHGERICFYQSGRRDRRFQCDCRSRFVRTLPAGDH